ncbi:hypothetical protein [Flammeovirga sp. SJP92]|uniref:hypothetical protein n=1 Tax=Flammeovirga sp. SJP92 TaxID=1775430 RepID=UPI000787C12B|nr:hypothetical protein [Flammeovirga sp. SJP92]KXX69497.1 hypothetical protein AVL50_15600 [Flammeovirga sp. SJP92]
MSEQRTNAVREKLKAEKAQLKEQTQSAKKELVDLAQGTVSETQQDIKKIFTYGAALVVTYSLSQWALRIHKSRSQKKYLKKLSKLEGPAKKGKKIVSTDSHESRVPSFGKMLRDEATVFLMGVAKEEILNYLESRKEKKKK